MKNYNLFKLLIIFVLFSSCSRETSESQDKLISITTISQDELAINLVTKLQESIEGIKNRAFEDHEKNLKKEEVTSLLIKNEAEKLTNSYMQLVNKYDMFLSCQENYDTFNKALDLCLLNNTISNVGIIKNSICDDMFNRVVDQIVTATRKASGSCGGDINCLSEVYTDFAYAIYEVSGDYFDCASNYRPN